MAEGRAERVAPDIAGADSVEARLSRGISEFNGGRYFEAHDTLEDLWMDVRGRDRLFFQGLVQLGIACYHVSCANWAGADHLFGRGILKLEAFRPVHCGVKVDPLVAAAREMLAGVRAVKAGGAAPPLWRFPMIERSGPPD